MERAIGDTLNDYLVSRNDAVNVFLVRRDGTIVVNEGGYTLKPEIPYDSEPWYVNAYADDAMKISNSHIQNLIMDRYKWVVSCSTRIMDEERNSSWELPSST